MRWGAVCLITVLLAAGLAGCQKAKGPAYACSTAIEGKTAVCMQFSNVPGGAAGVEQLRRSCVADPQQRFGGLCATDGLVGCCTTKQPDGANVAMCYYKGGPLMGTPALCAKDGGLWSTRL